MEADPHIKKSNIDNTNLKSMYIESNLKTSKFKNPFTYQDSAENNSEISDTISAGKSSHNSLRRSSRIKQSTSKQLEATDKKLPKSSPSKPQHDQFTPGHTDKYFSVIYSHPHKYDEEYEDGILVINSRLVQLYNSIGKVIIEEDNKPNSKKIKSGNKVVLSKLEIEINDEIAYKDFASGECFLKNDDHNDIQLTFSHQKLKEITIPEGAFVLDKKNKIYVIPHIAKHLRDHQKSGVKFMYDCITGKKTQGYYGCILADNMGLGKTLQTIALLYPLLKKDKNGQSILDKSIIVVPSSLLENWKNEFEK